MNESMAQLPKKMKEDLMRFPYSKSFQDEVLFGFRKDGWKGMRKYIEAKHFKDLGVKPEFLQQSDPGFEEIRHRLNTERGIIICNHPGLSESPIILSVLERDDVKVLVAQELFDSLPPDIAQKYFFSANKTAGSLRAAFKGIGEHIKQGGVLLMYPQLRKSSHFEPMFISILQKYLKPEDMVYCFNVNSSDTTELRKSFPVVGLSSEFFLSPVTNINKQRGPITIRTAEAYTKAGEWQSAITGVPKDSEGLALTEKYESMFVSNK